MDKILADLHTHLNEKKIDPKNWWLDVKKKKLSIVAITEHVEYNPKLAFEKLEKIKPKNIILVPGMEAKTTAGHFLIYGEDKSIYDIPELQKINVPIKKVLEIIKENNLTGSFAHPYGYKTDSTCAIIGEKETKKLIKKYEVGVEYYNGMLGSANNFIFGTQWVKKLYNFFDFMSRSKAGKKMRINNKSTKIKTQLEQISLETFERVRKGIEISQNASYITVGSDAHYPRVIGTAIIEMKRKPKDTKSFLQMLKNKEIVWAGPNIYSKEPVDKLRKKELFEGLKYVTKNKIKHRKKSKTLSKIKNKIKRVKK